MMLKVNDEFLDFNGIVELDQQVKLFEEIDSTMGDFSYSFNLSKTSKNMRILGNPMPDIKSKIIYRSVDCDLLDESGITLHKGFLRVERINLNIECSFFSGNYNWISLLSGNLSDLDFSDLDIELTENDIANTWDNTDGIIFPLIDTGALITRSYKSLMLEDFTACIFAKTIFNRIFRVLGIKTNGDLFSDPVFDNLLICKQTYNVNDIEDRTSYVETTSDLIINLSSSAIVQFNNDSVYPFFDGNSDLFNTTLFRYTADVKEKIRVDLLIDYASTTSLSSLRLATRINGSNRREEFLETGTTKTVSFSYEFTLEAGDYVDVLAAELAGAGTLTIYSGSTIKITPTFIYYTRGSATVPNWTQQKFVSEILSLFCCVCGYDPTSKTLTIDFFEGIKQKEPIDLSEMIAVTEFDFEDFISSFAKRNTLSYQESDVEEIKEYNISEFSKYGSGQITVENDFLDSVGDILKSEFKSPISYISPSFSASIERIPFFRLANNGSQDFTSVTDSAGLAQFHVPDSSVYTVGELVRVELSTNEVYLGDYLVSTKGVGFIVLRGVFFSSDATGEIVKMAHEINAVDDVYIFINTKYRVDNVSQYSRLTDFEFVFNPRPNVGYSFFNLLNTGLPINDAYKQGLSFGSVNDNLSYQRTLIDKYWRTVGLVLNDPVKLKCDGNINKVTFKRLTPLRPIEIKTVESSNLYYLNRISGYIDAASKCDVDLIKLS